MISLTTDRLVVSVPISLSRFSSTKLLFGVSGDALNLLCKLPCGNIEQAYEWPICESRAHVLARVPFVLVVFNDHCGFAFPAANIHLPNTEIACE